MTSSTVLTSDLDRVVKLRSHLETIEAGDDVVLVITEDTVRRLSGPMFPKLLPLLDGRGTIAEIVSALERSFPVQDVMYALAFLEQHGYLDDERSANATPHIPFGQSLGLTDDQVDTRARGRRVALIEAGENHDARRRLTAAFDRLGIETMTGDVSDVVDLTIVLADDYLRDELSAINEAALQSGQPWFLMKLVGRIVWLGPLLVPGDGACWTCLAQRLRDNRRDELAARAASGQYGTVPQPVCDASIDAAVSWASTQAAAILASTASHRLKDTITSIDVASLATRDHVVVRRPQCPTCGTPAPVDIGIDSPLRLSHLPPHRFVSRPKSQGCRTSDRVCPPDETVRRLSHLVSPITGVVPKLVQQAAEGAGHAFSCQQITPWRPDSPVAHLDPTLGASGRGESEAEAKAACMAEAVERYCTTFDGTETSIAEKFVDVSDDAVHPSRLLGFSQRQYAMRRPDAPLTANWVPEPFDDDEVVGWVPAWSVTHAWHRLLPTRYCYYDAPQHGRAFCIADSNGCAAGNVLEEAVLQGLYELIERDALAIWWYNRLRRPAVDLTTMGPGVAERIKSVRAVLSGKDRTLEILDLTNDIGVPVVAAVSWREHDGQGITLGCASHLDRSVAAIKAVGELNLHRVAANDQRKPCGPPVESFVAADQDALRPPETESALSDDLRDDIETLVARLRGCAIEVLVVDMTRPDINVPTVRVVAPGLCHHRNRLAPGRLYDVPVKLGWLASAHDETALNPLPCPL